MGKKAGNKTNRDILKGKGLRPIGSTDSKHSSGITTESRDGSKSGIVMSSAYKCLNKNRKK